MKTNFKNSAFCLPRKGIYLVVIICLSVPTFLKAKEAFIKDSVLIILKSGRDKRYYKSCAGKDVKVLSSFDRNQIEVSTFADNAAIPLVSGFNDTKCSENISLMRLALNNILTGKPKFETQYKKSNNH